MNRIVYYIPIVLILICMSPACLLATYVLSLDESRTGGGLQPGEDRYLTSNSMQDATQILIDAGFTVGTTPLFNTANISQADVLYTGEVNVDFTAQEISDIKDFVWAGGGLVILRDWGDYYPAADSLAQAFGATYNVGPLGIYYTATAVVMTEYHEIWDGPAGFVNEFDQIVSSSISGVMGIGEHSTDPGEVALAVTTYGAGRVVFLTDGDAWDSIGDIVTPLPGNNNAIVWENIFHWAVPEPFTLIFFSLGGLVILGRHK